VRLVVNRAASEAETVTRLREKVAENGGKLLSAAFGFLSQILPGDTTASPDNDPIAEPIRKSLSHCMETGEDGVSEPQMLRRGGVNTVGRPSWPPT
jgi:hypothetical protein